MRALKFLLPLMILHGCGIERNIDPALRPLLEYYLSFAPHEGNLSELVSFRFGTLGNKTEGSCQSIGNRKTAWGLVKLPTIREIIVISPEVGFEFSWKAAVMHELGHCLHNKQHSETPGDIMYGYTTGEDYEADEAYWEENLEPKMREMFPENTERVDFRKVISRFFD